jgi:hypothetical protein
LSTELNGESVLKTCTEPGGMVVADAGAVLMACAARTARPIPIAATQAEALPPDAC